MHTQRLKAELKIHIFHDYFHKNVQGYDEDRRGEGSSECGVTSLTRDKETQKDKHKEIPFLLKGAGLCSPHPQKLPIAR